MSDVLESGVVLQTGMLLLLHHLLMVVRCASRVPTIVLPTFIILIIVAALVRKVLRTLVFVRAAILLERQHILSPYHITDPPVQHVHIETSRPSR